MEGKHVIVGETYAFVATDSPARKHLEGTEFTVEYKKQVWRAQTGSRRVQVWRYFNADGVGARASELEPLGKSCHVCQQPTVVACGMCRRPVCMACVSRQETMQGPICHPCDELPF
jgi:hypothetical protein